MNRAFTKTKELVLDKNHKIIPDSDNGVILVCIGKPKTNKKGEIVPNRVEYHFPRIAQALRKYVDISLNCDNLILELIKKASMIYDAIDDIDKTFKQF